MFVDLVRSLDSPAGIAVDAADEMIYWTDQGNENRPGGLFSSHFDGTEVTQLFSGPFLSEVIGLTIDEERDHLYFTFVNPLIDGLFAGGIGRVNSDGSDMRTLVTGLAKPMGIAIDANGRGLYWADRGLSIDGQKDSGTIFASDIEGRNPRTLVSGLEMPFGVALDLENRDVYWSDTATGKIQRTGMFGALPFLEDVLTDLDHPTALAIVPEPTGASLLVSASVLIALVGRRWSDGRGRDPLLGRNLVCLTTEIQPQ